MTSATPRPSCPGVRPAGQPSQQPLAAAGLLFGPRGGAVDSLADSAWRSVGTVACKCDDAPGSPSSGSGWAEPPGNSDMAPAPRRRRPWRPAKGFPSSSKPSGACTGSKVCTAEMDDRIASKPERDVGEAWGEGADRSIPGCGVGSTDSVAAGAGFAVPRRVELVAGVHSRKTSFVGLNGLGREAAEERTQIKT